MPLYSYRCPSAKCDHKFEEQVSLVDFDIKVIKCPKCGEVSQRELVAQRSTHTSWKHWRLGD